VHVVRPAAMTAYSKKVILQGASNKMESSYRDIAPDESPEISISERVRALSSIQELEGLTDTELCWIASKSSERVVADGEVIFSQEAPPNHLIFVLSGEVNVKRHTSSPVTVFVGRTGRITGRTPFSRIGTWNADGRASGNVRLLEIHHSRFDEMLKVIPSMTERIVHVLIDRNREYARAEEQIGKLSALSKLAGNLAHELNNPASAARSAALALNRAPGTVEETARYRLGQALLDDPALDLYISRLAAIRTIVAGPKLNADPTFASVLEESICAWLDAKAFEDAWKLAPPLAEAGVTVSQLEELLEPVPPSAHTIALQDLLTTLTRDVSAASVMEASERIFRIVAAVKDYSYMDRQPVQDVSVAESLETGLRIFQPRLTGITVRRLYSPDVPLFKAFGSELNQVWAALIENSLEAMSNSGTLTLSTKLQGKTILVEVSDTGGGILAEHADRVFEPFFTTRPFGMGLGLGLDMVQRVIQKHFGAVAFESRPKKTSFYVRLPLDRTEVY
jgi:signal transduction histidine kinase